jgi:methylase of polypeptide subunit release factors
MNLLQAMLQSPRKASIHAERSEVPQTSALTRLRHAPCPPTIADAPRILGPTDAAPHPTSILDDPEAVSTLGTLLVAAGYTAEGLKERLGAHTDVRVAGERLTEANSLNTLIRLFFLGRPLSWQDAATALPGLDPDRLVAAGVLEPAGDNLKATVRLVPEKDVLVAYAPGAGPPEGSRLLANLTVRMHFVSALHATAGTGLHALLAARHTDRATAIEADPRAVALIRLGALLNGLGNLEALEGASLEPVAGHSYGLIVADPPRVLSPEEDERADTRCRELVKAVAAHLSEGGFADILATWVLGPGEDWWAPLEHWVENTGCDAILLLEREDDPAGYAGAHAAPDAVPGWTSFLRDLAADRVASGAIVLRRRSRGTNWIRHEVLPNSEIGPAGDQLVRTFVNQDLLASLPADDQLLEEVLAVVEPQRIEQIWRHKDEGMELESARARLEWGLGFSVGIDAYTIELLARVDGRRRLRELFAEIARDSQLEEDSVARAGLPAVRRLLELGFLARA